MLVLKITDLVASGIGSVPEAFRGTVKRVFNERTGEKEGRKWKLQKLIITDGKTDIEAVLDNRETVSRAMEGKVMFAIAGRNQKDQLSGMKRKEDTYKNKTTQQIWVYDGAELSFEGSDGSTIAKNGAGDDQSAKPAETTTTPAKTETKKTEPPPSDQPAPAPDADAARSKAMHEFNIRLGKNCSAMNRCFDAAFKLADDVKKRHPSFAPSSSDLKEMAVTLFIQSGWVEKPGEIPGFPTREFQSYDTK